MRITSNLIPKSLSPNVLRSHFKYIGGVAVLAMSSSFNRISSFSLGYSSNLPND